MAFADTSIRTLLFGFGPVQITLATACQVGDPLGYSTGWKQADANNTIYASLVAGQDGVSGDIITAFCFATVDGFTGGTAGGTLYLSDTAGKYASSAGTVNQVCGQMASATVASVRPVLTGTITNVDVDAAAAIAFSKLAALTAAYILVGNGSNVATAVAVTGDIGVTNAGVVSITGDSIINADVKTNAAVAWSKMAALASAHLLVGSAGNVATDVAVTGDISIDNAGLTAIVADSILNADVKTTAAIAWSKLAALTSAHLLVGSAGNVATDVAVTGDISIDNAGLTAIVADKIINADVKTDAAIAFSKLAALTDTHILVGNGSAVAADVAVSGDATLANTGALTIDADLKKSVICTGPIAQADALNLTVYLPKCTVTRVRSFLSVILATANSVVTVKNQAGDTAGTLTITSTGTVGDEDTTGALAANNTFADGDKLTLAIDGGASAGEAIFFIEYTHTA